MTKGAENELTVAVPINVKLNALVITDGSEEVIQCSVLGCVARTLATVGLRALVLRGAACVGIPVVLPISINITTIASLISSSSWWWLTVLAPQPISGLSVDKTWLGLVKRSLRSWP